MFKYITTAVLVVTLSSCSWEDPTTPPRANVVATSPSANINVATVGVKKAQDHTAVIRDIAILAEKEGLPPNSPQAGEIKTRSVLVEGLLTQARVDLGKAQSQTTDLVKERDQYLTQWQNSDKSLKKTESKLNQLVGQLQTVTKQRNILGLALSIVLLILFVKLLLRLQSASRLF